MKIGRERVQLYCTELLLLLLCVCVQLPNGVRLLSASLLTVGLEAARTATVSLFRLAIVMKFDLPYA